MIFRPKIFISSTFEDNENIRQKIREYFYSVGAEPLLYEKELTPSIIPMAYRENIRDADFVIFIVRENYGTITDWNMSGTHEEYLLAHSNKIPIHVYLSKDTIRAADNPLIKDLKKNGVSYCYFENDDELYKKIQETTFTIAKEIMLSQIDKNNLPMEAIVTLAGNLDYERAIVIIQIIESMKLCVEKYEIDWINNNIILACLEPIHSMFSVSRHYFINWELNNRLSDMLTISQLFIKKYALDFTPNGNYRDYPISVLGKVSISYSSYRKNTDLTLEGYGNILDKFFKKYDIFKKYVQEMRTEVDLI